MPVSGRCKLYLLDSNDPANPPLHRGITSSLYGGWHELRLKQEMMLGIGGWLLLRELGLRPDVCHLNEGHAAFAVLERAREFMEETGQPFDIALQATRAGNIFTSHTAVPAGFDRFAPELITHHLGHYCSRLKISIKELLALGRSNPNDESEFFNMAYLAIRGSGAVNGVSRLHGQVSRRLFEPLFPRWPEDEVPVGHVTNGVHVPGWDCAAADALWTDACGSDRWLGSGVDTAAQIRSVSDVDLWQVRNASRADLVDYARARLAEQFALAGESTGKREQAVQIFDPNTLTLGFARRFASYKRPDLLLHDPDRLRKLLTNQERPVQLVIAGKAHPGDETGREIIHQWIQFIRNTGVQSQVAFLSDYDMLLAEHLVQGVDVWINTPRRPWEASGTSGMKVLVNGGLNLSELDGWWSEAYSPEVGWAIGDGKEHGDDPAVDAAEAQQLYEVLEREVVPAFYNRGADGVPGAWVNRIRESMAQLTPRFSAVRSVREYTERYYLPAAATVRERTAHFGAAAAELVRWKQVLCQQWPSLHFGPIQWTSTAGQHDVVIDIYFAEIAPTSVRIEIFANAPEGKAVFREIAVLTSPPAGANGAYTYRASIQSTRPASDFTCRAFPFHPQIGSPHELPLILWQR